MPEAEQGYLLQIREGGRVVAEAPLLIHDEEATWRVFSEGFGMMAHLVVGALYNTVRVACDAEMLGRVGPQVALKMEVPSKLTIPNLNGPLPKTL